MAVRRRVSPAGSWQAEVLNASELDVGFRRNRRYVRPKGKSENLAGKIQKKVGQIEKVLEK